MEPRHPAIARYLDALRAGVRELPASDQDEIVREIETHLGDARAAGRSVDDVLRALGPAGTLARAYAVELLLNPRAGRPGPKQLFLLLGVLAATGATSFIVVPLLLTLGIVFLLVGLVVWGAGVVAPFAPPHWVIEMDPILAVLVGPAFAVLGLLCLGTLFLYARFLVGWIRRTASAIGWVGAARRSGHEPGVMGR